MPKKKLTQLAQEYEISFEEAQDFVSINLAEEMVTGKGKNTWINDDGQKVFEEMIPINILYRGKCVQLAPNPNFIMVYINELGKRVKVRVPLRYSKNMLGKIVHVEADNKGIEPTYNYRVPTMS